jgi:serine/threonine protein kinase
MAPELLSSSIKTRQLDLFSLGMMVWELSAGRNPPTSGDMYVVNFFFFFFSSGGQILLSYI